MFLSFGGWGVDLFFCLSGFLITGILLETKRASNYFGSFYPRRFLRIFPVYYLVLAVLFSWALISPWAAANMPYKSEWPSYLAYFQNIPWCWPYGFRTGHMIGHFWSLAVEEQFYFVWPFVILLLPERTILWICGIGFVLALPCRIYLADRVFGSSWAQMVVTTSRMDGLLIGAALAIVLRSRRQWPAWMVWIPAIGGISILAWIALSQGEREFIGSGPYMRTFGVTAVALLAGAIVGLSQMHIPVVHRLLTLSWLRFLGRYSYGLYAYHVPVFLIASALIAPKLGLRLPMPFVSGVLFAIAIDLVSLVIAVLSFEYFESKFLQLKKRFAPRLEQPKEAELVA